MEKIGSNTSIIVLPIGLRELGILMLNFEEIFGR